MSRHLRNWIMAGLVGLLVACSGGGGGDSAAGVDPGPPPPGGPVDPPPPIQPGPAGYLDAAEIVATITSASIGEDGHAVVDFQLTDGNGTAILDLEVDYVRFVIAKLQGSALGSLTGTWQSYKNQIEEAGSIGPGTEDRLQATYERDGELTNNGDGTYSYRYATDVNNPEYADQAELEGLNLDYEQDRTHRVAIQFDNAANPQNPVYDWVPATGATDGIFHMQISDTVNCNRCHNELGIHGGNRTDVEYCVTCHNPGSTDANSGNTVDMKVMIHKIHAGASLPSVEAGGEYIIWGFRDGEHDYSHVNYPQDSRNCQNCHVGTGTTNEFYEEVLLTAQGDNWNEYPSRASCGSCHDLFNFDKHAGGQPDDSKCASCHSTGERAGSPAESHAMLARAESQKYLPEITGIRSTGPGETPSIDFRIVNPETGESWDILNDEPWVQPGGDSRLAVTLGWSTTDYTNSDNGEEAASTVSIDALAAATPNGDGSFNVVSPISIPNGATPGGIAATGSGAVTVEGHPAVLLEEDAEEVESVPMLNEVDYFSIDEASGIASPRREVVDMNLCADCHQNLVLHGSNRTDNLQGCVTCHNPRNTDREVRAIAGQPPTDGKDEESLDFKTMVHAIHAAGMRTNPLQIVGFRGFSTHVYDEEHVQYPGKLGDCTACHDGDSYQLPLADSVLGNTIDTGDNHSSPVDDVVITPASATCYACHETELTKAHMESNGGDFATSQSAIDDGAVIEQCAVCHGEDRSSSVDMVHGLE